MIETPVCDTVVQRELGSNNFLSLSNFLLGHEIASDLISINTSTNIHTHKYLHSIALCSINEKRKYAALLFGAI
jgi:hypothetical protein